MNSKDTASVAALSKDDVIAWIRAHPNCLIDHPELVAILEWPDDAQDRSGTTSLADFQARRLRQQVSQLQDQLKTLTQIAVDNEALMHRLHQVTLSLMSIDGLDDFIAELIAKLKSEFNATVVCLHLKTPPPDFEHQPGIVHLDDERLSWLMHDGPLTRPQCGRFTQEKLKSLLPIPHDPKCQSAAVVPMADLGVLVIGAVDQGKFQPHMGTLFLELLAATIAHRLLPASPESASE